MFCGKMSRCKGTVVSRFLILFICFMIASLSVVQAEDQAVDKDKPWRLEQGDDKKTGEKKAKQPSTAKKLKGMARDLLGRPSWSDRFMTIMRDDIPKLALHPLEAEDSPVALAEVQPLVDGLTQALIRIAGDRYAVVGRDELGAVVQEIDRMGSRSDDVNPLGRLFDQAQSDLLGVGSVALKGNQIILSYKFVETETGRIVSASQRSFKRAKQAEERTVQGLSLEGAASQAAQKLLRDVSNIRSIVVQGLRYEKSGSHSAFSTYFMDLLSEHLRHQASTGPRSINDLSISEFVVKDDDFRGLDLVETGVENRYLSDQPQDYLIKGRYWVLPDHVDVRLTLENAAQQAVSWRGKIVKSEIPETLDLVPPPAPVAEDARQPLGPFDLTLTSNKGENPLFRVGEQMVLAIGASQPAYVRCYYLQADGAIFQIFPNRFGQDSFINGGFTRKIPSNGMPFAFEFSPPTGVEAVKCYGSDQDLEQRLAAHITTKAFTPLSVPNAVALTKIFRDMRDITLSEASLIVTVQ